MEVAQKVVKNALEKVELSFENIAYTLATGYGASIVPFYDHTQFSKRSNDFVNVFLRQDTRELLFSQEDRFRPRVKRE